MKNGLLHKQNVLYILSAIVMFILAGVSVFLVIYFLSETNLAFVIIFICFFLVWLATILFRKVISPCPKCGKNVFSYPRKRHGLPVGHDRSHRLAPPNCPHCNEPLGKNRNRAGFKITTAIRQIYQEQKQNMKNGFYHKQNVLYMIITVVNFVWLTIVVILMSLKYITYAKFLLLFIITTIVYVVFTKLISPCPRCRKNVFSYPRKRFGLPVGRDRRHVLAPPNCPHCNEPLG